VQNNLKCMIYCLKNSVFKIEFLFREGITSFDRQSDQPDYCRTIALIFILQRLIEDFSSRFQWPLQEEARLSAKRRCQHRK